MNEEKYILFDKYLNNELNSEEIIEFENELTSNSEMATSFDIFKDLNGHLDNKFGNENDLNQF